MRRKHREMNLAAANAPDTLKKRVTIGDIVTRTPITFSGFGNKDSLPMKGTVIYVHPKGRFHVVEFPGKLAAVREAFFGV